MDERHRNEGFSPDGFEPSAAIGPITQGTPAARLSRPFLSSRREPHEATVSYRTEESARFYEATRLDVRAARLRTVSAYCYRQDTFAIRMLRPDVRHYFLAPDILRNHIRVKIILKKAISSRGPHVLSGGTAHPCIEYTLAAERGRMMSSL